jgi:hypothetical protein
MPKFTTYRIATHWCHNSYILCNNITEIDPTIYDNAEFDWTDEDGNAREFFQYYITDASQSDVEWLTKTFDLLFTYSDKLDCYILCVDHCGTGWDYVSCEVKSDDFLTINPDCEYKDSCNPPRFKTTRTVEV